MEKLLTLRGLLFGALGGLLSAVFMIVMAEPVIDRAIDYESGRDEASEALEHHHGAAEAAGSMPGMPGMDMGGGGDTELFSRTVQGTLGAGVGMIAFGIAMGGIAAVVLSLWWHRRGSTPSRGQAVTVVAAVFAAAYLLPSLKYPANPPSVGNGETIGARTGLFLLAVLVSALVVAGAAVLRERLRPTLGERATWIAVAAAVVVLVLVFWLMPSLGELAANADAGQATETPQPLTDDSGHILYPGFPADDLYRFRLYSLLAQVILWVTVALGLRGAVGRLGGAGRQETRTPVGAAA